MQDKEPFFLPHWPWGEDHIALNALTFFISVFFGALLVAPPLIKIIGWWFHLWGLP